MRQHNLAPSKFVIEGEGTKKHKTAKTSIDSFKEIRRSGQLHREKAKVLEAIRVNQPVTSRMISSLLSVERSNITRSLYDLVNSVNAKVKIAYLAKCPITNKTVQWYTLTDWPQTQLFTP